MTAAAPPPASPRPSGRRDLATLVGVAWDLDRRGVVRSAFLLLANGVTGGLSLALLLPVVRALSGSASPGHLGPVPLPDLPLAALLGLFVLLTAAQAAVARAATVTAMELQLRIVDRLRQQALDAVLAARWSFVLSRRRTDIVEIVTSGASRSGFAFQQLVAVAVTAALAAATALVALLVAPLLALPSFVGVGLLWLLLARTAFGPAHRMGQELGLRNRRLQAAMAGSLDSLRLVRTHDAADAWREELAASFAGTRETQLAHARRTAFVGAVSTVGLAACASLLVLVAVGLEVPPTSVAVVLLLVARLAAYARSLALSGSLLLNALPAVGDLRDLVDRAVEAAETPPATTSSRPPLDPHATGPLVVLREVTYRYPGTESGVHGLDLEVPRRQVTALAGPSGAGKSTTADLVLGLLSPQSGEVLVDGAPLTPPDLAWWRQHVAYVPQETTLVDASLRQNLLWSVPREVPDDECWAMLDRCAAGFARRLPEGLDTRLGEHGIRLSGGERQRVALARALLRRPTLLVLDEATSSLDDETEAAVVALVDSLVPAVTVLVIAHRRSTLDAAHHVVRIVDGRTT